MSDVVQRGMHPTDHRWSSEALARDHLAERVAEHAVATAQRTVPSVQPLIAGKLTRCIIYGCHSGARLACNLFIVCDLIKATFSFWHT